MIKYASYAAICDWIGAHVKRDQDETSEDASPRRRLQWYCSYIDAESMSDCTTKDVARTLNDGYKPIVSPAGWRRWKEQFLATMADRAYHAYRKIKKPKFVLDEDFCADDYITYGRYYRHNCLLPKFNAMIDEQIVAELNAFFNGDHYAHVRSCYEEEDE